MLERRASLILDRLNAAQEALVVAEARYNAAHGDVQLLEQVRSANAGDWLTYEVQGKGGGGHVIGVEGEYFTLMSGPLVGRTIRKVHAKYITGVNNAEAEA